MTDGPPRPSPPSKPGRTGVVDIGSNSVRFVVYEALARTPITLHNEKTICRIGRNVANTGLLYREGCELALASLNRYRILSERLGVVLRLAVATAAARDALNGAEFVAEAEKAWGAPIRILNGQEEARLAGLGVIAGQPDATGVVGDLGGGSLDMVCANAGRTGNAVSLPFGPLRLSDLSKGDVEKARKMVTGRLAELTGFWPASDKHFYAVGGIWRALARVDMERQHYPLHVLQNYVIPQERAQELCNLLSRQGKKSLGLLTVVSKRRAEMLPFGAVVLQGVLSASRFKSVVVCGGGVREGLIFDRLPAEMQATDPLIEYAECENARLARAPAHGVEMFDWASPAFADETPRQRRLRRTAFLFSDIGWRKHPDYRAVGTYAEILHMPFGGVGHDERVFVATAVFHRYCGDTEVPAHLDATGLLDRLEERMARRIGLAARLAFDLSGAASGELRRYPLQYALGKLTLRVPFDRAMIADETVTRRFKALAAAMDSKGEIATE